MQTFSREGAELTLHEVSGLPTNPRGASRSNELVYSVLRLYYVVEALLGVD